MTAGLRVEELSVAYGGVQALDGVGLAVEPGEVVGLIGPNGAGKTTLIDAVSGFTTSRGHVVLDGVALDGRPPHVRTRAGLVRTFQSVELFDDLTVRENLVVAALRPRWWTPAVDALAPRRGRDADVDWALEAVGIGSLGTHRPTNLSHGQRRLVALARGLVSQPRVLLLDEPAAGLDTAETGVLGELLRGLPERDLGVLLVDHDMELVLSVCSRVVVLDFGRVIASGTPMAVRDDPVVARAYLGTAGAGA